MFAENAAIPKVERDILAGRFAIGFIWRKHAFVIFFAGFKFTPARINDSGISDDYFIVSGHIIVPLGQCFYRCYIRHVRTKCRDS